MPNDLIKTSIGAELAALRALAAGRRRLSARDRLIRERRMSERQKASSVRDTPRRDVQPEAWRADD
ncbi:MAG: hypothetical protein JWQ58_1097 [Reyranella sp.]|nr:hypothetical protein [Reyranella sp.]